MIGMLPCWTKSWQLGEIVFLSYERVRCLCNSKGQEEAYYHYKRMGCPSEMEGWFNKLTSTFLSQEINPVDLAEYVDSNGLSKEPAFRWWVKQVLKRRGKNIGKFKTKRRKNKMKYGIKVPATVEEARLFGAENGDTLWQDAINKEMANSRIAFEVLEEGESAPVGYTQIMCHLIFDVKMDLK